MNWLRRLFAKDTPKSLLPEPRSPALDPAVGKLGRDLLTIRFESLLPLVARWPLNDRDLKDWDRVAERAKRDATNPMSAAVALDVKFTSTFWQLALSNEIWNFEACDIQYLSQQASLFHMDEGDRNFEQEAELNCRILVALKRLSQWNPEKPVHLNDCRDLLGLCEVLPATEDKHTVRILGFIVNHTIALPGYHLEKSEFQFWNDLVRLLERSVKGTHDSRNIAAIQNLRAFLQQHWDLKEQVVQFTSNKSMP